MKEVSLQLKRKIKQRFDQENYLQETFNILILSVSLFLYLSTFYKYVFLLAVITRE